MRCVCKRGLCADCHMSCSVAWTARPLCIRLLQLSPVTKYPGLASEIRAALTRASMVGVQLSFVWVPSHGKRPAWEAPAGMCSELLRLLNNKADRAAHAASNGGTPKLLQLSGSIRPSWPLTLLQPPS